MIKCSLKEMVGEETVRVFHAVIFYNSAKKKNEDVKSRRAISALVWTVT